MWMDLTRLLNSLLGESLKMRLKPRSNVMVPCFSGQKMNLTTFLIVY